MFFNICLMVLIGVMDKLTSHSVWTISICRIFFAKFGFVQNRDISFNHHVYFSMGEGTLKYKINSIQLLTNNLNKYNCWKNSMELINAIIYVFWYKYLWIVTNTYFVSIFAFTIKFPIFAHFSSKFVYVRSGWSEIIIQC